VPRRTKGGIEAEKVGGIDEILPKMVIFLWDIQSYF
jgi:hypothetical protein